MTVADGRADKYQTLQNPSVEKPADATVVLAVDYAKLEVAKVALTAAALPRGASLRADGYKGKIIRVDGVVAPGGRLAVEFLGETYDVFSHDAEFRKKLRADFPAGQPMRFYGELGQYKERWQFIIQDPSWVK